MGIFLISTGECGWWGARKGNMLVEVGLDMLLEERTCQAWHGSQFRGEVELLCTGTMQFSMSSALVQAGEQGYQHPCREACRC